MKMAFLLRRRDGMALVVTLSLVVLVTVAAVAFFSRATSNRAIESSRANEVLADQLAQTAAAHITGQFLQEISAGSSNTTVNGTTIFRPKTPANAVPQRRLSSEISTTDTIFSNLIRQSAPGSDPFASANNTTTPSSDGRAISLSTWNAPLLTVNGNFTSNATAPTWIYVLKNGTFTASVTTGPSGNEKSIIGRFAYNAYDIGGLLDANVAGHPTSLTPSDLAPIKNTQAGADLTALGLSANAINDLVAFRNPSSSNSTTAYRQYVEGARRSGFLSTTPTSSANATTQNNFFTSRQDLIRYAQSRNPALLPALPYLTHFSRELNAPSWSPTTPTGSSKDYAAEAESATSANRHIPNVRAQAAFVRLDGSTAAAGEPLIEKRFPLSRLTWLEDANLNSGTFEAPASLTADLASINQLRQANGQSTLTSADLIQKTFGLRWNTGEYRWDYVGHTGATLQSAIKNLDEVATDNREPNFFETLKAGILSGSLGLGLTGSGLTSAVAQLSVDLNIFRIGASCIDQNKLDSYPTRIAFKQGDLDWVACGIQRLPYISRWTQVPLRNSSKTDNSTLTLADYEYAISIIPILWNPTQGPDLNLQGDGLLLPLPSNRPDTRISIQGDVLVSDKWDSYKTYSIPRTALNLSPYGRDNPSSFGEDSYLTTIAAPAPQHIPTPFISPLHNYTWGQFLNNTSWIKGQPVGYRLEPSISIKDGTLSSPQLHIFYGGNVSPASNPFQLSMEFRAPNGNWYPYSLITGVEGDDITWPTKVYARAADLKLDGANYNSETIPQEWRNMVPYSYSGAGSLNYATSEWDFIANFCQVQIKADPRSIRFNSIGSNNANLVALSNGGRLAKGLWNMPLSNYRNDITNLSLYQSPGPRAWSQADAGLAVNENGPDITYTPPVLKDFRRDGIWEPNQNDRFFPALLCRNVGTNETIIGRNSITNASYKDRDGVTRLADCGLYPMPEFNSGAAGQYADTIPRIGNPFLPGNPMGNNADRPIVLNRPFRSVAELGYVFRDQPFKTLDFFSATSADGALLDLFCLNETDSILRAGAISANTRQPVVLKSLLAGAVKREQADSPPQISASEAETIASSLAARTTATPLANKADLPSAIQTLANTAGLGYGKASLESVARSLGDVIQTRTWGIFAQIIAQSGRWANGRFVIDAEKHVWVSTAIDRPLGKIIDQNIEYVTNP